MARREVRIIQANRPFKYCCPFPNQEHTLLLCVVASPVTDDEMVAVSREIVTAQCRYAVCWGHECSRWDSSIDQSYIETDKDFNPPDETFVMTTWHENEPIEDAVEFWWMNTSFGDYESTQFAILILGDDPTLQQKLQELTTGLVRHWNQQESNQNGENKIE